MIGIIIKLVILISNICNTNESTDVFFPKYQKIYFFHHTLEYLPQCPDLFPYMVLRLESCARFVK